VLGLTDPWIIAVYLLCILSTLLCVVYGAIMWNKGDEEVTNNDKQWAEKEEEIVDEF